MRLRGATMNRENVEQWAIRECRTENMPNRQNMPNREHAEQTDAMKNEAMLPFTPASYRSAGP